MRIRKYFILLVYSFMFFDSSSLAEEQVPDVTISADSFNDATSYTFRSPITISKEEIQNSGAHNISDILQQSSDIQLQKLYEGSSITPSMRGFGDNASSNVLILINGMPTSYSDMSVFTLDTLPLNDVERIDILPGSAGVLYGDQAVGGVINIITPQFRQTHYQSTLMLGSYDSVKYNLGLTHPIANGLNAHFEGEYYSTDNYRPHNQLTAGNASAGINKQYASGSVQLDYRYYLNNLQYPGALTAEQIAENRRQAQNTTDFDNQNHHDVSLQWKQIFNDNYSLNQGVLLQTMHGVGVLTDPFNEQRDLLETNPTLLGAFKIKNKPVHYQTGISLQYSDYVLAGSQFSDNSSQYKESIFSQFVMTLTRQLDLTIGARGAQSQNRLITNILQQTINSAVVSELGLAWKLKHHLKFYLRRAGNYRFPKAEENALSLDDKPLNTQQGVSYETGLTWEHLGSQLLVNLYQLDLTNEIMYVPSISGLLGTNQNLSPTQRFGGSINYQFPIYEKIKMNINYSYINARFSAGPNQGNQIPFVAANKGTVNVDYRFLPHWALRIESVLLGPQFPDGDITNQGALLQGYAIFNIVLRYKYKYISVIGTINNMTNVRYNSFAQVSQSGPNLQTFYYPAPTRNFWLNLTFDMS